MNIEVRFPGNRLKANYFWCPTGDLPDLPSRRARRRL